MCAVVIIWVVGVRSGVRALIAFTSSFAQGLITVFIFRPAGSLATSTLGALPSSFPEATMAWILSSWSPHGIQPNQVSLGYEALAGLVTVTAKSR